LNGPLDPQVWRTCSAPMDWRTRSGPMAWMRASMSAESNARR
jgi:hypothetical protein